MEDHHDVRGPGLLEGAGTGLGLAVLNVLVIAALLGIVARGAEVMPLVMVYGGLPAVALGIVLGVVAAVIAGQHPWVRRLVLGPPAFALVWGLATMFEMRAYAELAAVPTLLAVLALEHRTRRVERPLACARVR